MPAGHRATPVTAPTASRGEGCPTVRRFARSQAEAFADVRAAAVERPAPTRWQDNAIEACLWVLMAVVLTAPFWWHLVAKALR